MKWLKRILFVAALLVVVAMLGSGYVNGLVKEHVEASASQSLGVQTSLDVLRLGLLSSDCDIRGLNVSNPQGFSETPFLSLGSGRVAVALTSLLSDEIRIPELTLEDLSLNLEVTEAGANYETILENVKKGSGGAEDESDKRFIIDRLVMKSVHLKGSLMGEPFTEVTIPEVVLENVGSDTDGGVVLDQLTAMVVQALLVDISVNPAILGDMPAELLKGLQGDVGRLVDLKALDGILDIPGLEALGKGGLESLLPGGLPLDEMGKDAGGLLKGILGK